MTWFAVIEKATGILVSEGTVVAGMPDQPPMPDHLEAVKLGPERINWITHTWDAETRKVVKKPPKVPHDHDLP